MGSGMCQGTEQMGSLASWLGRNKRVLFKSPSMCCREPAQYTMNAQHEEWALFKLGVSEDVLKIEKGDSQT